MCPEPSATSVAVPRGVQEAPLRSLSEMDEESLLAVADTVTRVWRRAQLATVAFVVGPFILSPFLSLLGLVPAAIADELARRSIRDDVRSLGFDRDAEKLLLSAWRKSQRSWRVKLTSKQKRQLFVEVARSAREKALIAEKKRAHLGR